MVTPHVRQPDGQVVAQPPIQHSVFVPNFMADTPTRHKMANTLGVASCHGCGMCLFQVGGCVWRLLEAVLVFCRASNETSIIIQCLLRSVTGCPGSSDGSPCLQVTKRAAHGQGRRNAAAGRQPQRHILSGLPGACAADAHAPRQANAGQRPQAAADACVSTLYVRLELKCPMVTALVPRLISCIPYLAGHV
jgi:hypothetical protein